MPLLGRVWPQDGLAGKCSNWRDMGKVLDRQKSFGAVSDWERTGETMSCSISSCYFSFPENAMGLSHCLAFDSCLMVLAIAKSLIRSKDALYPHRVQLPLEDLTRGGAYLLDQLQGTPVLTRRRVKPSIVLYRHRVEFFYGCRVKLFIDATSGPQMLR